MAYVRSRSVGTSELGSPNVLAKAVGDAYAVDGFEPELAFDFTGETYRTDGSATTFSGAMTHSATSLGTMVDGDGAIKWRPHNLLTYSEEFAGEWVSGANSVTFPGGSEVREAATTGSHYAQLNGQTIPIGQITAEVEVQGIGRDYIRLGTLGGGTTVIFRLSTETVTSAGASLSASVVSLGDGYYRCKATWNQTAANTFFVGIADDNGNASYTGDVTKGAFFRKKWLYRSDLGGMVNNPDRGDSYVPTTSAAVYLPRRGHYVYNGQAWTNRGLLLESEARTNLLTYSEDFSNAAWGKTSCTIAANTTNSPDGTLTADTLVSAAATASTYVSHSSGVTVPGTYGFSVYVKTNGAQYVQLFYTSTLTSKYVNFDLSAGTVAGGSYTTASITDVGGGWYRIQSIESYAGVANSCFIAVVDSSSSVRGAGYTGNGTSGIHLWGAQLEAGSTPSSYMPTEGATFTRAAETLTVAAADLPYPTPNIVGSELVTNGTFDSDTTGWTPNQPSETPLSVDSNRLKVTTYSTSKWNYGYQIVTTEVGKVYRVQGDFIAGTATSGRLFVGTGTQNNSYAGLTSAGSLNSYFVATTTTTYITLQNTDGVTGSTNFFDNISVKEMQPLALGIQMQGTMTRAVENASVTAMPIRWSLDGNNQIRIWHDSSIAGGGVRWDFDQEENNVIDQVSSGYIDPFGINVPFNIASRHGSTFINGAVDGTALTANTTPTALPDLSATNLQLGYDFMGTIDEFRMWGSMDIGDTTIASATS